MLVHFPCERCGADLTARPDYAGRTIPCSVCRHPMAVPAVAAPAPLQPRLRRVEIDDELAAEIAARADAEARVLAMTEARCETSRSRAAGVALICAGLMATAFGAVSLFVPRLWIPQSAALVSLGFGIVVLIIGSIVRRLALETMQDQYRRRVPFIADRLRRRYLETHHSTSPPTSPPITVR